MARMTAYELAAVQKRDLPLKISKDLCAGKTYIVTGANTGLGLEAARHLVAIGAAKVIMAARNLESGEAARADVEASTGIKGVAEVWHLDLSSYASVLEFAEKATETLDRIDAVVENAAVAGVGHAKAEGHLRVLTVNVLSTFLLAVLLLPKLRSDAKKFGYTPRLSLVTSGTGLDMEDVWNKIAEDPIRLLDSDEEIGMKVYPTSKLLEVLAVRHIAQLLPVSRGGVIINTLDPGLCETSLSRNSPEAFRANLKEMWAKSGRTPEGGSRTLLAAAVAGEDSHGSYMNDCVPSNDLLPEWVKNEKANKQAWDGIAKELEQIQPSCISKAFD